MPLGADAGEEDPGDGAEDEEESEEEEEEPAAGGHWFGWCLRSGWMGVDMEEAGAS